MRPLPLRLSAARRGALPSILAVLALSFHPVRGEEEEVLTLHRLAELRRVLAAEISPDGSRVAYVLEVPRRLLKDEDGPAWAELHVTDRGGNSRPFVTGEVNVKDVAWTPDGGKISFLAKREGDDHSALYVIPADGGEARRILSHGADIDSHAWSPSGRRVAFLAEEPIPPEEQKLRDGGFNQEVHGEDQRPMKVWIGAPDDPDSVPRALDLPGSASSLRWSPVGSRLAVALAPSPSVDDTYTSRKVHVVDAETGVIAGRLEQVGKLGPLAWSPDGASLAVVSSADAHDPAAGRLVVVPATGGAHRELLPGYAGHVRQVAWGDPDTVLFLSDEGVWTSWGEVRRDGAGRKSLVGPGRPMLTRVSVSRDGRTAAFVGDSPGHPSEVFLWSGDSPEPVRLTDSNPWLSELPLASQEVISFKARDGLDLEGILIRPLDAEEGKRYPLILVVHGGPEAHYRNGWLTAYSRPGQVAAARGFAVFHPNYRGSTGRGVEFSKLGQGDPAGREFDDLVDAVDHLAKMGLVDPDRVGITGGSYGGYASAWGSTYFSERFAASVVFVGISDKLSKTGTTDIPEEEYLVHARKRPWEDWMFFLERSPIYHAARSRTPTLILHGTKDPRVPPGQSRELFLHLKRRGRAPVRLVLYPGERHGNRRAASRFDLSLRLLRWMEHYLKGPGGDPPPYALDYGLESGDEKAAGDE